MAVSNDSKDARDLIRNVVHKLQRQYQWSLVEEDVLVEKATQKLLSVESDPSFALIKRTIIQVYTLTLYEACKDPHNPTKQELAYIDLYTFLIRSARKRWAGMDELVLHEIAQRAISLVYEKIDDCQKKQAFLKFATFKLMQAYQDEQRMHHKHASDGLDFDLEYLQPFASPHSDLLYEEKLSILLDAIRRIKSEMQKQTIFLKFFEGMSDKEIALQLKISEGNVRVNRNRGLKALRHDEIFRQYFQI